MTPNLSLEKSSSIMSFLRTDFLYSLVNLFPFEAINEKFLVGKRDKVFNTENTLLTMVFSATQQDKTLQNSVNIFKRIFEGKRKHIEQEALKQVEIEKAADSKSSEIKSGRKKLYKPKIKKSKLKEVSTNTAAYTKARGRISLELMEEVFYKTRENPEYVELWHGMETRITDGTYFQMQDTPELREKYDVKSENGNYKSGYPQGLIQAIILQGSGLIDNYAIGSRHVSELSLIYRLIGGIPPKSLLLADDLYNSFAIFSLAKKNNFHIIVPGKRERRYTVIKEIAKGDEIVEIKKKEHPKWLTKDEILPKKISLRRLEFTSLDGKTPMFIYTTILDESIEKSEIILKYYTRWDIEITIREIKTIMDINVVRGKSEDIVFKEFAATFTAYNIVRKIIMQSSEGTAFSPKADIIQEFFENNKDILIDSKGRKYNRWSPGRVGKAKV